MRKLIIIIISIFLVTNHLFAQKMPAKDLDFLLQKIKNVYAGYKEKVNEDEFNRLVNEVKNSNSKDTFAQLAKLTGYFKDHHLSLFNTKELNNVDSIECSNNLLYLNKYIKTKKGKLNDFEGYWMDEINTGIIFLKKISKNELRGYIIETKKKAPPGFCTIKMKKDKGGNYNADIITLRGSRIFSTASFKTNKILVVNSFSKWKKLDEYKPGLLDTKKEFSFIPELKIIDSNNVLIRMPDFGGYNVKIYDSIIAANEDIITKTKNLILDIRNNGGGTSGSFKSLVPYVCTNPIIRGGGYQLCSEEIITDAKNDMQEYIKLKDTATIEIFEKYIKEMENNKNKLRFVNPDTLDCEPKPNNIKNIAIIINHGCRSAAELMILWFKQSKKVKVFGEPTAGAVDYLDMLTYTLPTTGYTLWVATVKRLLTKENGKYDNIGIRPDIQISDNESDWVKFVQNYYEKN